MIDCVVVFADGSRLPGKINGQSSAAIDVSLDPTTPVASYPPSEIVEVHVPDQHFPVTLLIGAMAGPDVRLIITGGPAPLATAR